MIIPLDPSSTISTYGGRQIRFSPLSFPNKFSVTFLSDLQARERQVLSTLVHVVGHMPYLSIRGQDQRISERMFCEKY